MDSIEVSDQLTIGGAPPLGQDAIDKLQSQIVSPSQTIYVDQKNGNDSNDGTTITKAVRTLDKALTLIKPYTNTVSIQLQTFTEKENLIYNTFNLSSPIDINNTYHVDTFNLIGYWDSYRTDDINAKIIVPYGFKRSGQYDFSTGEAIEKKCWGNFLFTSGVNVSLQQVIPVFPDNIQTSDNFVNAVFSGIAMSVSLSEGRNNKIMLPSTNTSILNCYLGSSFDRLYFYLQNIQGSGFLTKWGYPAFYINDPLINPEEQKYPGTGGTDQQFFINKVIKSGSSFASQVLGETKGIDKNINVIYSNL